MSQLQEVLSGQKDSAGNITGTQKPEHDINMFHLQRGLHDSRQAAEPALHFLVNCHGGSQLHAFILHRQGGCDGRFVVRDGHRMQARKQLLQVSLDDCRVLASAQDLQQRKLNGVDEQTDPGLCLRSCESVVDLKAPQRMPGVYIRGLDFSPALVNPATAGLPAAAVPCNSLTFAF